MGKNLLNTKEYFERYLELCTETETYKEAYHKIEEEVRDTYGVNKYSTYESFKTVKSRHLSGSEKK